MCVTRTPLRAWAVMNSFVMLVNLSEDQNEAATRAEHVGKKIHEALNQSYGLKEINYNISSSIGASQFIGQQIEIDALLKQADMAMYKAKDAGRNTLRFFDPDMETGRSEARHPGKRAAGSHSGKAARAALSSSSRRRPDHRSRSTGAPGSIPSAGWSRLPSSSRWPRMSG